MASNEMIGKTMGHYRIVRPIGYGGMATVFLAEDTNLQREVALKVFFPRPGETLDFLRRFAREARVLAKLDHPHILPVYDYGEQDTTAYLVMPYMQGGSLRGLLRAKGSLPAAEAVKLIDQALDAVEYAHERGLIHRDIKPDNMLFKADGTLLLSDFGLVKVLQTEDGLALSDDMTSTTTNGVTGTPHYMAPEQIMGQAVPASDIYALGVVLYEMLSGQRLFPTNNPMETLMKHVNEPPRPLHEVNPAIPLALSQAVMHALEKDPAQRYQQIRAFRQALQDALRNQAQATTLQDAATAPRTRATTSPETPPRRAQELAQTAAPSPQASPASQDMSSKQRRPARIITLALLVLLLGASVSGVLYSRGMLPFLHAQTTRQGQQTPRATGPKGTPTKAANTQPVPTTMTTCPPINEARAAVITPLKLGTHASLVYIANAGPTDNPTGTIARRDPTTGQSVEITSIPHASIKDAQLSQDGQWVLFTATVDGQDQLRMVRMDNQGLQTLYCASRGTKLTYAQWSFDQKYVIFDTGTNPATTFLLDMGSGMLHSELVPQNTAGYVPRVWLDNARLYLTSLASPQASGIYLLDTRKGPNQHEGDLQQVAAGSLACISFDGSYDATQMFMSTCTGGSSTTSGPSTITVQPADGGTARNVYVNPVRAITAVRVISRTTLLMLFENTDTQTDKNGLWRINTDGTGLQQLSHDPTGMQSLCQFSQNAWSNVSRDGTMYALQSYDAQTQTYSLFTGTLDGQQFGQLLTDKGTQLGLVGWTTM